MIRIIVLLSFIYALNGQCPEQTVDNCSNGRPANSAYDCCIVDGDSCVRGETIDCATTDNDISSTLDPVSTTEIVCDDSDLTQWRIDYIGKSTQFRLYDPCDSKFIKFKMEDLTEYNAKTGKKTNNKETSFASAKDWSWGRSGVEANYKGNDAILNVFNANQLTKGTASFILNTWFFKDPTNITDPDNVNNTITIYPNTLKFDTIIENWEYQDPDNYLVLCIGIMTNKAGDIDDDPDTKTFYLQEFQVANVNTAYCIDSNGNSTNINVVIDRDGNGNNHLDLCYTFDPCPGDIKYDPIVRPCAPEAECAINMDYESDTNEYIQDEISATFMYGYSKFGVFVSVCLLWFYK